MYHSPIHIKNLCLSFSHKICFEDFSATIEYGSRIAIIGRNGSGKSTLLKILRRNFEPHGGSITIPENTVIGYVPQIVEDFETLSGGQRLNKSLTQALSVGPNILLLDEPTNHLDIPNRQSLMRMLRSYAGTLIVVSHDVELLRSCIDTLWHIDGGKINVSTGNYDDYMENIRVRRLAIEVELARLERQKDDIHLALMKEQRRAAKSRAHGKKMVERRRWLPAVAHDKANSAEKVAGKKNVAIENKKRELNEQLSALRLPEVIVPTFFLTTSGCGNYTILSIGDGTVGYADGPPLLTHINLSLQSRDRVAILGRNGSGKSTLVRAILGSVDVVKSGDWKVPKGENIGYLDQHYNTLRLDSSPFESICEIVPTWPQTEVRKHLATFLFRKNEEVNCPVNQLSGGEKARLTLAQIAAKTPQLLILDEIGNNLDLETRQHVIQVLKDFPGAMILISHDADFLEQVEVCGCYTINDSSIGYECLLR